MSTAMTVICCLIPCIGMALGLMLIQKAKKKKADDAASGPQIAAQIFSPGGCEVGEQKRVGPEFMHAADADKKGRGELLPGKRIFHGTPLLQFQQTAQLMHRLAFAHDHHLVPA